jgi:hypothetical protein
MGDGQSWHERLKYMSFRLLVNRIQSNSDSCKTNVWSSKILTFGIGGSGQTTSVIMEIEKQTYKHYCGLRDALDRAKIKCCQMLPVPYLGNG